jgi:hypothetical protein
MTRGQAYRTGYDATYGRLTARAAGINEAVAVENSRYATYKHLTHTVGAGEVAVSHALGAYDAAVDYGNELRETAAALTNVIAAAADPWWKGRLTQ